MLCGSLVAFLLNATRKEMRELESMRRVIFAAAIVALLGSCSTAAQGGDRWWIRLVGFGGSGEGVLLVQVTDEPLTGGACVGRSDLKKGRVLEKRNFGNDPIRNVVGVSISEGRFFAELTPGICDASLTLSGTIEGDRARGEVTRTTFAGPRAAGSFTADRLR
jgi:hypothetical protein